MSDAAAILALYDHARAGALPCVLATVVGTHGSTYRKAGARMMLCGDGSRVGVVSGGCLEADVARRAWFLKGSGEAELVRYDTGNGDDATYEFGLGCRGVVDVLVERLDTSGPEPLIMVCLRRSVEARETIFLQTTIRGTNVGARTMIESAIGASSPSAIIERIEPPVQVIVFGSGVDVEPVLSIARAVGWGTVVVSGRLKSAGRMSANVFVDESPGGWQSSVQVDRLTAAVLMTHRMADDAGYLRDVLATDAMYIGCLGPRSRTEALFDEIAFEGVALSDEQKSRIHAPVGLDVGAERPQEIALAIVAEIQAAMTQSSGEKLSTRAGAIHRVPERIDVARVSNP